MRIVWLGYAQVGQLWRSHRVSARVFDLAHVSHHSCSQTVTFLLQGNSEILVATLAKPAAGIVPADCAPVLPVAKARSAAEACAGVAVVGGSRSGGVDGGGPGGPTSIGAGGGLITASAFNGIGGRGPIGGGAFGGYSALSL